MRFNGFRTPLRLIWMHESHYNSRKWLLTGSVWHLALCSTVHSHWPVNLVTSFFAKGAMETEILLTALCPLKRWQWIPLNICSIDYNSSAVKEQQNTLPNRGGKNKAHRRHSDLTNITTEIENAALMFHLCDTTLGHKLCGWLTM